MDGPTVIGAACAAGLVALLFVRQDRARERSRDRHRRRERLRRAFEGEDQAIELARLHGYRVLARQASAEYQLRVDGELETFTVRADLLLERRFRRYVGEVKTGSRAPSLGHGPTRRQLLEYGRAFGVRSVLLFDMETATIRDVRIDPEPEGQSGIVLGLALGLAFALLGALLNP